MKTRRNERTDERTEWQRHFLSCSSQLKIKIFLLYSSEPNLAILSCKGLNLNFQENKMHLFLYSWLPVSNSLFFGNKICPNGIGNFLGVQYGDMYYQKSIFLGTFALFIYLLGVCSTLSPLYSVVEVALVFVVILDFVTMWKLSQLHVYIMLGLEFDNNIDNCHGAMHVWYKSS